MINNQEGRGALSYQPVTHVQGTMTGVHAAVQVPPSIAPVAASVPPMSAAEDLDRELEALAQGVRQKRRNRLVVGMGLILAAAAAFTVNTFDGKVKAAEAAQAEAVAARIAEQDRIAQLNLELEARNRKISELSTALDAARSDTEKAQKEFAAYKAAEEAKAAAAEEEEEADEKTSKAPSKAAAVKRGRAAPAKAARGARAAASKKSGKCVCKQGDPLCGCL
ncbi:hypothetical protein WMF37_00315 [Sorangium sp. So ce291]|uniref:hypothetical protein n=1 Tax=Sorangium sp. So ce291 TaxID=3133294 RepID=UPI003F6331E6